MGSLLPLILGGIFQGLGSGSASSADASAQQAEARQQQLQDYLLGKTKDVYDPIREQKILPALLSRAQSAPFYGKQALQEANALSTPMELNYA